MTQSSRSALQFRLLVVGMAVLSVTGALTVWRGAGQGGAEVAPECRAAQPVAARLASLATGELAAVDVKRAPQPMPELAFTGPTGEPTSLGRLKGRTLLVNLWATWCVPCRREMPALDALQARLGGESFEVVAINVDTRDQDRPKAWLRENGIRSLAYYSDPQAAILGALQRTGHVVGLPTTILVDAAGCEIAVLKGPAEWAGPDALAFVRAALGSS